MEPPLEGREPVSVSSAPSLPQTAADTRISRRRLIVAGVLGSALGIAGFRLLRLPGGFRINTVERPTPAVDPAAFRLTVDGAVDSPVTLSLDQVKSLPSVRQISDFHCVEGWGVNDVRWEGVRLQSLIDMVKPARDVDFLTFYSSGGEYKDSLTLQQAMLSDALLAYHMYEQPLSKSHGYPLRLVMPRMYGYKGPKWLERIEFVKVRETGYWEQRGWKIDAWIA
jgi:DMSO/TMAO reductase YedYZ molybdopterin-dependent catalytic subunit